MLQDQIVIDVKPIGCVRMTQRGKWVNTYAIRYLNYKRYIKNKLLEQCKEPFEGAVRVDVTFIMPVPDSWSEKKKREHIGLPVTVKSDIDNLVKGLLDSANGIIWKDDRYVTDLAARKRYGYDGQILINVRSVDI